MHYNPFAYIHSEKDILKLVTTLIANTKGEGKAGDDFWVKAETLLYCALIGYIHYEAPVEEQNFSTLIEFINAMEVREDDEEFKNPVDLMFDALEAEKPNHFAVRQYKKYKLAAGKTAKSILISCGARLAVFDIAELREVTAYDELELDTLGDRKTALFLIMSDTAVSYTHLDVYKRQEEGRQDAKLEKIQEIPLSELHPFKNHPFKVKDDEAMMETADSIKQYGVLVPAIARPDPEGGYELVAGHRRHRASELAEKETMPVIVRDLDDDAATILSLIHI